ncbi:MAG: 2-oxoacid:acceptor oxidoreductase subunit alpha [Chloroflexota bacterium]
MSVENLVIRIGGESGDGIITAGDLLTLAAARCGYYVHTFRTYPAEIRGGPVMFQLRVGVRPVPSLGDLLDILVAFNEEAWQLHGEFLKPDGVLVYDPDEFQAPPSFHGITYAVPFGRVFNGLNMRRGKNVLVLGAVSALFDFAFNCLDAVVAEKLGKKRADYIESNRAALMTGFRWVRENLKKVDTCVLGEPEAHGDHLVMSGNNAIVVGALQAGCRFFAGYPITPASDIMQELAMRLPLAGGAYIQSEDEISAISSVVGAAYAGLKAMTATAGPGLSLMVEVLGLATMAELPLVVVDAQRGGPSTGLPTKMEQSDLNLALYGAHGDAPRFVLAPRSVEDALYQMIRAFNMAETYQMPVIVLSDQSLSHRTETVPYPDLARIEVVNRRRPTRAELKDYQRYALTPDGISPFAVPGLDDAPWRATGLEHDAYSRIRYDPETHTAMTEKRWRKVETAARRVDGTWRYGAEKPQVGIVTWGSTAGSVREATERLAAQGWPVAALAPALIHPLPAQAIRDFTSGLKAIIVPEVNYEGQFARHLRAQLGLETISLNKYGGLPFAPGEILNRVTQVLQDLRIEPVTGSMQAGKG